MLMQFRLRTLLIVLALGPMVLAAAWAFVIEPFVVTPAIYIRSQIRQRDRIAAERAAWEATLSQVEPSPPQP